MSTTVARARRPGVFARLLAAIPPEPASAPITYSAQLVAYVVAICAFALAVALADRTGAVRRTNSRVRRCRHLCTRARDGAVFRWRERAVVAHCIRPPGVESRVRSCRSAGRCRCRNLSHGRSAAHGRVSCDVEPRELLSRRRRGIRDVPCTDAHSAIAAMDRRAGRSRCRRRVLRHQHRCLSGSCQPVVRRLHLDLHSQHDRSHPVRPGIWSGCRRV